MNYSSEEWLGSEPDISEGAISETVSADIVVLGGGLAGVSAARQAVELGATVALFEKCERVQARSGDFAVMDSKLTSAWGRGNIDKAEIVSELMRDMAYKADQDILRRWAEEAGKAFDWYMDPVQDIPVLESTFAVPPKCQCWLQPRRLPLPEAFDNKSESYKCYQVTAWVRPTHIPVLRANYEKALATGRLKAFFSTPGRKLIVSNSQVIGAICESDHGYVKAIASKGVILATGDYMSDKAMLKRFLPGYVDTPKLWTSFDKSKNPSNTGDGHKMGAWIGARIQDSPHASCAHHMGSVFGCGGFLLLNSFGRRFANEDAPGQQIGSQIEGLPDKTAWQFVDGSWRSWVELNYASHGGVCYALEDEDFLSKPIYKNLSTIDNVVSPAIIAKAVKSGVLLRSDSLEDLIRLTGLPESTALEEINRYNSWCQQGSDPDFGKQAKRLFPVLTPPFYAAKFRPAEMIAAMGGLQSDSRSQCYDNSGKVIPGLFLAGNVQGGRFAVDYPLTVPGISHSMALVYGRVAARSALGEI
ncbi:MAG: FAD-binding protein [Clostridiales bacterium]|jgi:succinate dehydrogenase/fumarate reductase flavoprotein subunit|nr:FAD-binding protein [Clostridiales bacterium]